MSQCVESITTLVLQSGVASFRVTIGPKQLFVCPQLTDPIFENKEKLYKRIPYIFSGLPLILTMVIYLHIIMCDNFRIHTICIDIQSDSDAGKMV